MLKFRSTVRAEFVLGLGLKLRLCLASVMHVHMWRPWHVGLKLVLEWRHLSRHRVRRRTYDPLRKVGRKLTLYTTYEFLKELFVTSRIIIIIIISERQNWKTDQLSKHNRQRLLSHDTEGMQLIGRRPMTQCIVSTHNPARLCYGTNSSITKCHKTFLPSRWRARRVSHIFIKQEFVFSTGVNVMNNKQIPYFELQGKYLLWKTKKIIVITTKKCLFESLCLKSQANFFVYTTT